MHPVRKPQILIAIFISISHAIIGVKATRFTVSGPVVTISLKDPSQADGSGGTHWMDIGALRPEMLWSVQSQSPPLPNWLPSLRSVRANLGYRYEDLKRLPSFVEGELKLRSKELDCELEVKPSYEVKSGETNLLLQLSRGASYILARMSSDKDRMMDVIRASYHLHLPFAAVNDVRLTPSWDFSKQSKPNCILEGSSAVFARTRAVLKVDMDNPTLAIVHGVDDRNTIAPEISLKDAKITYKWDMALSQGAFLRTRVDPTSSIHVTWTDKSVDGGKWITDFRLPLAGTVKGLAADVKIRRQFAF